MPMLRRAVLALTLAYATSARAVEAAPTPDAGKAPAAPNASVVAQEEPSPATAPEQRHEEDTEPAAARGRGALAGLQLSGYADVIYVYNVNRERGTFQFVVPIDKEDYAYDNSYMGTAALDVLKELEGGTRFRLTIVPKRSSADVVSENGIVQEASVSIPLAGDATRLIAGQLPDWQGYEYSQPTLNKLITHNLLFDFTTPDTYVGAGLELTRGKWVLKAMVVNLNTSIRANGEAVPAFVYRADYGGDSWGFGIAGAEGPKKNFRTDDANPVTGETYSSKDSWTDLLEVDGWVTRGGLTLNAQLSFGQQRKAAVTPDPASGDLRDARWYGASALVAYEVVPAVEVVLRADYLYNRQNGGGLLDFPFADPINGVGPGQDGDDPDVGADRYALSAGLRYVLDEHATLKLEYRYDGATKDVFGNRAAIQDALDGTSSPGATFGKRNSVVAAGVVVSY